MKQLPYLFLSAAVMLGLPWLAVTFAPGDAGMAVCFLLFFAVDPLYAIYTGFRAGKMVRTQWYQPLVTAVCFLAGAWLLFDPGEPAFVQYAMIYLVLGYAAMAAAALIQRKKA